MTPQTSSRKPVKARLAIFLAGSLYAVGPAWCDGPAPKTPVLMTARYYSKSSLDNAGTKALEGFLKLSLERIADVRVFSDEDNLQKFCGHPLDKCAHVTASVVVLERNDEAQLFTRLQLADPQNQRRIDEPDSSTVSLSKLPSGIADLVEQIADAINPNHADPVRLEMGCLQRLAEPAKGVAEQLLTELTIWLRDSPSIMPIRRETSRECTAESFKTRAAALRNAPGRKSLARLESTFTAAGDNVDVALTLWRDRAAEPVVLPNIVVRAPNLDEATVRRIGTVLQGLLGAHSGVVEAAIRSPPERLKRAEAMLRASQPDYDAAFALFELALWDGGAPEDPAIHYADALSKHSRGDDALAVLREAREHHKTAKLDLALAKALSRIGDYKAALAEYQVMQDRGIELKDSLLGIIETQIISNDLPAAWQSAAKAMQAFPNDVAPVLLAAQIKESEEKTDDARALYKSALAFPHSEAIKSNLALLDIRKASTSRDQAEQIQLLSEAIDQHLADQHSTSTAYFLRAYAYTDLATKLDASVESMGTRSRYFAQAYQDYLSANAMAEPLDDYPFLVPNLIEMEIMNGRFEQAGSRAKDFFGTIAQAVQSQTPANAQDLRAVTAYLSALAKILSGGRADNEKYLSEVLSIDVSFSGLDWDFRPMNAFLGDFVAKHPDLKSRQVEAAAFIGRYQQSARR